MNKQHGFAALEAIFILVVVAIIGGTGYYIWHTKQNTDAASSASQTATTTPAQKYLNVPNFGIKIPLSEALAKDVQVSTTAGTKTDPNAIGQVEISSNDVFHSNNSVSFCGTATNSMQELLIIDRDDSETPATKKPIETMTVSGHTYSVIPVTTPDNNSCSSAEAKTRFAAKYQALLVGLKHAVAQ